MTIEIVIVALIAGLASGAIAAVVMGAIQAWMARPKSRIYRSGARRAPPPEPGPPPTAGRPAAPPLVGPFDRFDASAKRILGLAQDEAIRLNHNYIGTEHLLLALVRHDQGVAAEVLRDLGVSLDKVRTAAEFIIGRGESATSPSEITLSPRTKKVIELAIDEARKLGHLHVGADHILLGLVREGEGIASGILESLGVRLEALRATVLSRLGRPPDSEAPPPGESAA